MAQRVARKRNRKNVKGVAVKRTDNQQVTVNKYGNVTSVTVTSGKKRRKKKNG